MTKTCIESYDEAMERRKIWRKRALELTRMMKELTPEEKIDTSMELIKKALSEHDRPTISCSFGKDSMVMTHLVHQIKNVPLIYNDTGVAYPETKQFIEEVTKEWNLTVIVAKSEDWTFWKIVKKYGYPKESRSSKTGDPREPKCCKLLKYDPTMKALKEYRCNLNFVGTTGDEGRQRRSNYIMRGPYYYAKTLNIWRCTPIIWWTSEDIWEYIELNNIPVHPAYKKYNLERLGCMPCTGYINWRKTMAERHFNIYKKITRDMGQPTIEEWL